IEPLGAEDLMLPERLLRALPGLQHLGLSVRDELTMSEALQLVERDDAKPAKNSDADGCGRNVAPLHIDAPLLKQLSLDLCRDELFLRLRAPRLTVLELAGPLVRTQTLGRLSPSLQRVHFEIVPNLSQE